MIIISKNTAWYLVCKKLTNKYKGIAPAVPKVPGIPGKRPAPNQIDNIKATLSKKRALLIAFNMFKISD